MVLVLRRKVVAPPVAHPVEGPDIGVIHANNLDFMRSLPDNSFASIVTDPPYELGFMGKAWDKSGIANSVEFWTEVLRVLKPGGHLVSFSSTRTYHRMACAIEDAGFEIRDQLAWTHGQGFPKSMSISKAMDKAAGATREVVGKKTGRAATPVCDIRGGKSVGGVSGGIDLSDITAPATPEAIQWDGWGTNVKPAWEPICLARKPISEPTVVDNVLKWGTGALNIDACRITTNEREVVKNHSRSAMAAVSKGKFGDSKEQGTHQTAAQKLGRFPANLVHDGSKEVVFRFRNGVKTHREGEASRDRTYADKGSTNFAPKPGPRGGDEDGRFPANVIHDGSPEVLEHFPETRSSRAEVTSKPGEIYGMGAGLPSHTGVYGFDDEGSVARFFYCAKASKHDRMGSKHPTVKPVNLMRWLVRLVTPPGGIILDPFGGTGTTGAAAFLEGFDSLMIEREREYVEDILRRKAFLFSKA